MLFIYCCVPLYHCHLEQAATPLTAAAVFGSLLLLGLLYSISEI